MEMGELSGGFASGAEPQTATSRTTQSPAWSRRRRTISASSSTSSEQSPLIEISWEHFRLASNLFTDCTEALDAMINYFSSRSSLPNPPK